MRENNEAKRNRLKADLARAKEKANEWQARARDIERQITELENMEIIQTVRGLASASEDLRDLLDMIPAAKISPQCCFLIPYFPPLGRDHHKTGAFHIKFCQIVLNSEGDFIAPCCVLCYYL